MLRISGNRFYVICRLYLFGNRFYVICRLYLFGDRSPNLSKEACIGNRLRVTYKSHFLRLPEFVSTLENNGIPLLVFSAGVGEIIKRVGFSDL